MTTQELKNKIEKVLGNNIRCLLPSYWWKNLFHSVADRIDEVETTITENVNDMVVKSLKEFEAKHPDMASNTLVYTEDETSAEARSNATKLLKWALSITDKPSGTIGNTLYVAVPVLEAEYNSFSHVIQSPVFRLAVGVNSESTVEFLNVPMSDGQNYNIVFGVTSGVATLEPASSSSGGGSVMFVADPLGDLTEEQKQNNADAFLKVLEAEGAIDINIMVMFFIAKPNMVSVNDNGDLVLIAAGIDGGASKFIFTPEGDVTIETVEPTSSGGVEIRELHISQLSQNGQIAQETQLTDEQKAWNLETIELVKQKKAIATVNVNNVSILLQVHNEGQAILWGYIGDDDEDLSIGVFYDAQGNTNLDIGVIKPIDFEMSDTSKNAVQNKVIKKYIDDAIANVGGGGGGNIVVDTEISSTSTNPVQNKVVYSELQKKQDTISDLADIRSGAALGKTALQSEQYKGTITGVSANGTSVATSGVANIPAASTSTYGVTKLSSATNSTSTSLAATASAVKAAYDLANSYKGTVTGVKINGTTKNPSSGVVDLGTVITAHQDISHLATKEELNSLTNEIISNERVHAASLVDIDARIQDILTRLNNAGL